MAENAAAAQINMFASASGTGSVNSIDANSV